jgi:hypothetical protein
MNLPPFLSLFSTFPGRQIPPYFSKITVQLLGSIIVVGRLLGEITIKKADIIKIIKESDEVEYDKKVKDNPPTTAEDHRVIAQWCKAKGLDWLLDEHMKKAKQLDKEKEDIEKNKCNSCGGKGKLVCQECNGTGKNKLPCAFCDSEKFIKCPMCEGVGKIDNSNDIQIICPKCQGFKKVKCPNCDGKGEVENKCEKCNGMGYNICPDCAGKGIAKNTTLEGEGVKEKTEDSSEKEQRISGNVDALIRESIELIQEYNRTEDDAKKASLAAKWKTKFSNKVFSISGEISGVEWIRSKSRLGLNEYVNVAVEFEINKKKLSETVTFDKKWSSREVGEKVKVLFKFNESIKDYSYTPYTFLRIE